jgi:hypothetical protein
MQVTAMHFCISALLELAVLCTVMYFGFILYPGRCFFCDADIKSLIIFTKITSPFRIFVDKKGTHEYEHLNYDLYPF